jgi:hypothetical protein
MMKNDAMIVLIQVGIKRFIKPALSMTFRIFLTRNQINRAIKNGMITGLARISATTAIKITRSAEAMLFIFTI